MIFLPVFVVTVMFLTCLRVGDGSFVPVRSLAVSVVALARLLVRSSVSVSSCALLSGAGSGCRLLCDVGDVAIGESAIACLLLPVCLLECGRFAVLSCLVRLNSPQSQVSVCSSLKLALVLFQLFRALNRSPDVGLAIVDL